MIERTNNDLQYASDKVNQLLAHGRWFSPGKLIATSSTTKTGRHAIAEILLKVALSITKSINQLSNSYSYSYISTKLLSQGYLKIV